ncbi:hypothetical protein FOA43_001496 [Brettanomyces nanus]|uniref:Uncharacterized protein n=1 Tax=Eeniella nana TaxID=13502 RepID=A0A875S255_EENNA|nr:uncharacterized protein FOA43_001496 [Brettanomyces nanus]QPG74172.1 hypothetical protein FOA43_001496 [Brettanomyces nanus]
MTPGIPLDFLDGRMLQYHYASERTLKYILYVKELIHLCQKSNTIPCSKFVTLQSGIIFNVNDNIYRRSEILLGGRKFNATQSIDPMASITPINFDCLDNNIIGYDPEGQQRQGHQITLPQLKSNLDTLKLLELLLINTFEIYKAKLEQAKEERGLIRIPEQQLIWKEIDDKSVYSFPELEAIESLKYTSPPSSLLNSVSQDAIRSFARINELGFLAAIISFVGPALQDLEAELDRLKAIKTRADLVRTLHYSFLMHRSMTVLLRFADLYAFVRRNGKQIYLNHGRYLANYGRLGNEPLKIALQRCEHFFVKPKMNGMLLATISKFTRQGSNFPLKYEYLMEFYQVGSSMLSLLQKMITCLKTIQLQWTSIVSSNRQGDFDRDLMRQKVKKKVMERRQERELINVQSLKVSRESKKMQKQPNVPTGRSDLSPSSSIIRRNISTTRPRQSPKPYSGVTAVAKAAITKTPPTAQQRLQKHIMEAAQNGSIYGKKLQPRGHSKYSESQMKGVSVVRSRSGSDLSRSSTTTNNSAASAASNASTVSNASAVSDIPARGNLTVCHSHIKEYDDKGKLSRKVRFKDVPEYTKEEDAPTPLQMQKQLRQKFSNYKPQFINRTKYLNLQEGMVFRQFRGGNGDVDRLLGGDDEFSIKNLKIGGEGRFSKLFKRY